MNDPDDALDLTRFEQLLDTWGADIARFPKHERTAAAALLRIDARAQRMFTEAAALERGLSSLSVPEPSAALRRAVAEIPLRHPQPELAAAALFGLPRRSVWALVASAVLAVALGALSGAWASELDLSLQASEQADRRSDGEYEDEDDHEDDALNALTELAFAAELDEELSP